MNVTVVLDCETYPDFPLVRQAFGLAADTPDDEAERSALPQHGEGPGILKPLYQQLAALSVCMIGQDGTVRQLDCLEEDSEAAVLGRFWGAIEAQGAQRPPRIVTWNGRRFDLPVLVQRALYQGVTPKAYWAGNYRDRYRGPHLDLMDYLADFGGTQNLSQNEAAVMLHLPGKLGVSGGDVRQLVATGDLETVRGYNLCDVATLTGILLRVGSQIGVCTEEEAERGLHTLVDAMASAAGKYPMVGTWLEAYEKTARGWRS